MKNLNEKALLVSLSISTWTARKYDRTATNEVNTHHQAQDAGRFNKLLIAKNHLDEIQKIVSEARAFHYDNTLPWSDFGERLLTAENYFEYTQAMSKLKDKFETTVDHFCTEYPAMITEAKIKLNTLFNQADYPSDVRKSFDIKSTFMPIPDTKDFRVDLSKYEVDSIKQSIQLEVNERFAMAAASVYTRITDQLKKMHERLSKSDAVFRDSLFENLKNLIDLLPRLNVMDSPMIESLCEDMRTLLVDPETVRTDKDLRAQKANEVNAILRNMEMFLNPGITVEV